MRNIPLFNDLTWKYIKTLKDFGSRNISLALVLMVITSLTEGIGLLLLVPLLQLVGLDVQQGSLGQIADIIASAFIYLGIEPTLASVLLIFVLIISLNAYLMKLQTTQTAKIEYQFAASLRKGLFKYITGSDWLFFTQNRSSDFAHSLTYEIERITLGTGLFLSMIASLFILAVYLIFALQLSGLITALIFLVGIVLLLLLKRRTESSASKGEDLSTTSKDMYSASLQHLDGMKTVKSFNMEDKNVEEFSKVADRGIQ